MKRCNRIHSHCRRGARVSLAVFGAGLSLGLGGAGADELSAGTLSETVTGLANSLSPELEDAPLRPPRWLGANLFYAKGGLEYRRELKLGDHPIELGFQGPLMHRMGAGVTVEMRF